MKRIILKPLTEEQWKELQVIKKKCSIEVNETYEQYLEEDKKNPKAALFG